jgi:hypothetical protein
MAGDLQGAEYRNAIRFADAVMHVKPARTFRFAITTSLFPEALKRTRDELDAIGFDDVTTFYVRPKDWPASLDPGEAPFPKVDVRAQGTWPKDAPEKDITTSPKQDFHIRLAWDYTPAYWEPPPLPPPPGPAPGPSLPGPPGSSSGPTLDGEPFAWEPWIVGSVIVVAGASLLALGTRRRRRGKR